MWVGWMNLENLYGSQESLVKVFESALRENEPLDVFTRLVAIYQQSQKFDVSMMCAWWWPWWGLYQRRMVRVKSSYSAFGGL